MSITINYEGTLDDPSRITEFIYDMKFHCRKLDWPCNEVNNRILGDAYYYLGNEQENDEELEMDKMALFIGQKPIDDRIKGVLIEPPGTENLSLTFNRAGELVNLQAHHISDLDVKDGTQFWDDLDLKGLQWEHGRMNALLNYFRKPDTIKSILEAAGIEVEDMENIRVITPDELNVRPDPPKHMKEWGISAYEN